MDINPARLLKHAHHRLGTVGCLQQLETWAGEAAVSYYVFGDILSQRCALRMQEALAECMRKCEAAMDEARRDRASLN